MFALKENELIVQKDKTNQSHKEWFDSLGWFKMEKEEDVMNNIIRGYADEEGVYIYKGEDFDITIEDVDKFAPYLSELQTVLGLQERLPVYAGVVKEELGTKYRPRRYIGSVMTITLMRIVVWDGYTGKEVSK